MCDAIDFDDVSTTLPLPPQVIEPEPPSYCYKLFQSTIAKLILPSLKLSKDVLAARRLVVLQNENCRQIEVKMGDLKLDGVYLRQDKNPGQVMVVFWGAKGHYEEVESHARALAMQKAFEVDLVMVNYPGVGASEGFVQSPEVLDAYGKAVLDWTLKEFPDREIILYASSMGVYTGLHVLQHALDKKKIAQNKIMMIADKTYSRMKDVIDHVDPPTWFARFVINLPLMRPFLKKINEIAHWAIDNLAGLKRMHYSGHKPTIVIINHDKDTIIPPEASLARAVREWQKIEGIESPHLHTMFLEERELLPLEASVHVSWLSEYQETAEKCKEIIRATFSDEERQSA